MLCKLNVVRSILVSFLGYSILTLCITQTTQGFVQNANSGAVRGQVLDSSDVPLPNVVVEVINKDSTNKRQRRTNEQGVYIVPHLPPGRYIITAFANSFPPVTLPQVQINIGPPWEIKLPDITVGRVLLTIQVLDYAGRVLKDTNIRLIKEGNNKPEKFFWIGEDGSYSFPYVKDGKYKIIVSKKNYRNASSDILINYDNRTSEKREIKLIGDTHTTWFPRIDRFEFVRIEKNAGNHNAFFNELDLPAKYLLPFDSYKFPKHEVENTDLILNQQYPYELISPSLSRLSMPSAEITSPNPNPQQTIATSFNGVAYNSHVNVTKYVGN